MCYCRNLIFPCSPLTNGTKEDTASLFLVFVWYKLIDNDAPRDGSTTFRMAPEARRHVRGAQAFFRMPTEHGETLRTWKGSPGSSYF